MRWLLPILWARALSERYAERRKSVPSAVLSLDFAQAGGLTAADFSGMAHDAVVGNSTAFYDSLSVLGSTSPTAANGTLTRTGSYAAKPYWMQTGWYCWWNGSGWTYSTALGTNSTTYFTASTLTGSWTNHGTTGTLSVAVVTPTISIAPSTATIAAAGAKGRQLFKCAEDLTNTTYWGKRGAVTVGAAIAGPSGSGALGYLISNIGASGVNDFYQDVAGLTDGTYTRKEPSIWINRVSTSGIVTMHVTSSASAGLGEWTINLDTLGAGWQKVDRNHPAVTVVSNFVVHSSGHCGIWFYAASGSLSFYAAMPQLEPAYYSTLAVTGTLSPDATGLYDYCQEYNGRPAWKLRTGNYWIWWNTATADWRITSDLGTATTTNRWICQGTVALLSTYGPYGSATGTATVSAVQQLTVTGTTTPATAGTYTVAGWKNGAEYYTYSTNFLWLHTDTKWYISAALDTVDNSFSLATKLGTYAYNGTYTGTPAVATLASTTQYLRSSDNTAAGNRSFVLSSDGTSYWTNAVVTSKTTAINPDLTGTLVMTGTLAGKPVHSITGKFRWWDATNSVWVLSAVQGTAGAAYYTCATQTGDFAPQGTAANTATITATTFTGAYVAYEPSGCVALSPLQHLEGTYTRGASLVNGQSDYSLTDLHGVTHHVAWSGTAFLISNTAGVAGAIGYMSKATLTGDYATTAPGIGVATVAAVDGGYSFTNPGNVTFGAPTDYGDLAAATLDGVSGYLYSTFAITTAAALSLSIAANIRANPSGSCKIIGDLSSTTDGIRIAADGTVTFALTISGTQRTTASVANTAGWHLWQASWASGGVLSLYRDGQLVAVSGAAYTGTVTWTGVKVGNTTTVYLSADVAVPDVWTAALSAGQDAEFWQEVNA